MLQDDERVSLRVGLPCAGVDLGESDGLDRLKNGDGMISNDVDAGEESPGGGVDVTLGRAMNRPLRSRSSGGNEASV